VGEEYVVEGPRDWTNGIAMVRLRMNEWMGMS